MQLGRKVAKGVWEPRGVLQEGQGWGLALKARYRVSESGFITLCPPPLPTPLHTVGTLSVLFEVGVNSVRPRGETE